MSWDDRSPSPDYDQDCELDRWLRRGMVVVFFLAIWKGLEILRDVIRWLLA